jgi:hypothetical protein
VRLWDRRCLSDSHTKAQSSIFLNPALNLQHGSRSSTHNLQIASFDFFSFQRHSSEIMRTSHLAASALLFELKAEFVPPKVGCKTKQCKSSLNEAIGAFSVNSSRSRILLETSDLSLQ